MNYYWCSYAYGHREKMFCWRVMDFHPVTWAIEVEKDYPGQYNLLNFQEITKEQYELWEGEEG